MRLIAALVLSLIAFLLIASEKKGVGLADLEAADRIHALRVTWYYTWKPTPIAGAQAEFVPMIWGGGRTQDEIALVRAQGRVPVLLAINEPDKTDQANMSVEEVLRLWPQIEPLAERLSSPASAGALGPWFEKFHRQAQRKGLRYDFLAVHLYTPPDPEKFLAKIDAIYEKYRMPIWITEFAVADWNAASKNCRGACPSAYSEKEVLAFMRAVLPELEKRPFVERYAWFGAGRHALSHEQVRTSRLFEKDGRLTPLGCYYAQFSWPPTAEQRAPACEAIRVAP
jgi:hypothetical protein